MRKPQIIFFASYSLKEETQFENEKKFPNYENMLRLGHQDFPSEILHIYCARTLTCTRTMPWSFG